jgi:hypothetical protein
VDLSALPTARLAEVIKGVKFVNGAEEKRIAT